MDDTVTVGIASYPARAAGLIGAVEVLLPQVDRICVWYNGSATPPRGLSTNPKVHVTCAPGDMDIGSRGKFMGLRFATGYYITADDDISFEDNYVKSLVGKVKQYGDKVIVTYHGADFALEADGAAKDPLIYINSFPFFKACSKDFFCMTCGNGVCGYKPGAIGLTLKDLVPSMDPGHASSNVSDDAMLSVWAQTHEVPILCPERPANWLRELKGVSNITPLCQNRTARKRHDEIITAHKPWRVFTAPSR